MIQLFEWVEWFLAVCILLSGFIFYSAVKTVEDTYDDY